MAPLPSHDPLPILQSPKAESPAEVVDAALLFLGGVPALKRVPSYTEAVRLVGRLARLRDETNALLVAYFNWSDVRELPFTTRFDALQAVALAYSSRARLAEPTPRPEPPAGVETSDVED